MPGSANDISVLNSSPLMNNILEEKYPLRIEYTIANEKRTNLFFLADGIYPRWPIFMSPYSIPRTAQEKAYNVAQEGERKEVERTFGVLQGKFNIIHESSRFWSRTLMQDIVQAVVILHNMCVEHRTEVNSDELMTPVATLTPMVSRAQADSAVVTDDIAPPGNLGSIFPDPSEFERLR
jgi:Plant transposon protein